MVKKLTPHITTLLHGWGIFQHPAKMSVFYLLSLSLLGVFPHEVSKSIPRAEVGKSGDGLYKFEAYRAGRWVEIPRGVVDFEEKFILKKDPEAVVESKVSADVATLIIAEGYLDARIVEVAKLPQVANLSGDDVAHGLFHRLDLTYHILLDGCQHLVYASLILLPLGSRVIFGDFLCMGDASEGSFVGIEALFEVMELVSAGFEICEALLDVSADIGLVEVGDSVIEFEDFEVEFFFRCHGDAYLY